MAFSGIGLFGHFCMKNFLAFRGISALVSAIASALCVLSAALAQTGGAIIPAGTPTANAPAAPPPPPSSVARTLYESQKEKLLQIRVLVSGAESQSSAGSGFNVSTDGLIVTNYHVISQLIWEPERYRAEFVRTDNTRGAVSVVAIDVQHDLAVVRVGTPTPPNGWGIVTLAPDDSLTQGDRVYSLGNPLDLGFAISEGTYNGRPERSLYPNLLFTGAMNPGVSGGPAMDDRGRVVGVNVAGFGRAAELTNFQVPVKFVREIIKIAQSRKDVPNEQLRADMRTQLIAHQAVMLNALHAGAWKTEPLGKYRIPVIPDKLARCWGEASEAEKKNYRYETARCDLGSALYIDRSMRIGSVSTQHEYSTSSTLSAYRFSQLRKKSMENESQLYAAHNKSRTAARCTEDYIATPTAKFRAVVCARAYRKFEGLYDINTLVVSLDNNHDGLESTLTLNGVDYTRGLQESRRFIEAISRSAEK